MKSILVLFSIFFFSLTVYSQTDSLKNQQLNVFLDCSYYCDQAFIKEQITYINYVRDRKEADLHILITQQQNGSGGYSYEFYFIGLQKFTNRNDTLEVCFSSDVTTDKKREDFVKTLKFGLTQFVIHTPAYQNLTMNYTSPKGEKEIAVDKWKSWVFDISANAYVNSDNNYSYLYLYSNISASKITDNWKFAFNSGTNLNQSIYEYDGEKIKSLNTTYFQQNKIVKTINKKVSTGLYVKYLNSSYNNYKTLIKAYPSIEYNIFPYSESNRKLITATYCVGYEYMNFYDSTIYNKINENIAAQSLQLYFTAVQKWGNLELSIAGTNFLNDFSKNRVDIYTALDFRLFKGFSVYINGGYSFIHNQINIPKNDASFEEILLQQRMLATSFSYWTSFGFSYTFGSIYNNIVNPRLSNWSL